MGYPNGWADYLPIGQEIPGTRIIAFKTPLKSEINNNKKTTDHLQKRFRPSDCIQSVRRSTKGRKRLGLVLNLTFTTKYYNPEDFESRSVHYAAIKCPGHEIPNDELFDTFQRSLYNFFHDYPKRDVLVGVHCTHGVNRTGYMIARFLIQCEGWPVGDAISSVGEARGYPIERENYLEHLHNLHKPSYLFPKIPAEKDSKKRKQEHDQADSTKDTPKQSLENHITKTDTNNTETISGPNDPNHIQLSECSLKNSDSQNGSGDHIQSSDFIPLFNSGVESSLSYAADCLPPPGEGVPHDSRTKSPRKRQRINE